MVMLFRPAIVVTMVVPSGRVMVLPAWAEAEPAPKPRASRKAAKAAARERMWSIPKLV